MPHDVTWTDDTDIFATTASRGGGSGARIILDDLALELQRHAVDNVISTMNVSAVEVSDDEKFVNSMVKKAESGKVITSDEYRKVMRILKKDRHIDRSLRSLFHRMQDDGGKTMASVSVDDLVPA